MNLKSPISFYRIGRVLRMRGIPLLPRVIDYFVRFCFACWCPSKAKIGADCVLGYGGLGVVISESAVIGARVEIGAGVTIGGNATEHGAPKIEDDVYVGSGAKILGPVIVGHGSVIAANAVVTSTIPPKSLVGGIPAKVIREGVEINEFLYHRKHV